MTVFKNKDMWDKSNIEISDNCIKVYSKSNKNYNMKYIDYGLSLVNHTVFDNYKKIFLLIYLLFLKIYQK